MGKKRDTQQICSLHKGSLSHPFYLTIYLEILCFLSILCLLFALAAIPLTVPSYIMVYVDVFALLIADDYAA